jgi:predicted Zn-dependent protease with MMP-like domain
MFRVSTPEFEQLVHDAVSALPKVHRDKLDNVGFFVQPFPTPLQRQRSKLTPNQTLLGVYEGVPLSQRNGMMKLLPDTITIFQIPIESSVNGLRELKLQIKHTVWHEVAHYFGLNHEQIYDIEDHFESK